MVEGLRPGNFLAVRAGPGTNHRRIDQLHNGDQVLQCIGDFGDWYPIIYPGSADCGVMSGWVGIEEYRGPCRSGWVHRSWVHLWAG